MDELKRYSVTTPNAGLFIGFYSDDNGKWCRYEDAAAEIARLTARVAELEGMLREIVDSIPSTYDETDPTVIRHAAALNAAWNRFKEVGRDG